MVRTVHDIRDGVQLYFPDSNPAICAPVPPRQVLLIMRTPLVSTMVGTVQGDFMGRRRLLMRKYLRLAPCILRSRPSISDRCRKILVLRSLRSGCDALGVALICAKSVALHTGSTSRPSLILTISEICRRIYCIVHGKTERL